MSWLYVLVFGLAIIGWLILLSVIGLVIVTWVTGGSVTMRVGTVDGDAPGQETVPDPLPRRSEPWALVPYGTRGNRVHRHCAVNRQDACEICAPLIGRPIAPRQP